MQVMGKRELTVTGGLVTVLAAALLLGFALAKPSDSPSEALAAAPCPPPPFGSAAGGATVFNRAQFPGYGQGWEQGDELQVNPRAGGRFSKQALLVRGKDPLIFRLPQRAQRSVDLVGWGKGTSAFRADRIKIDLGREGVCEGAWPGGFSFTKSQCLQLIVKAGQRRARVPFGLGRSCNRT